MITIFGGNKKKIIEEPLICLKFDDGAGSDTKVAYPYLKSLGLKCSFMVPGGRVGVPASGGGRYEGQWEDYKKAIEDGFDVQCHSYNHKRLTGLTVSELHNEMQSQNAIFKANGLPIPTHHAFPNGDYDNLVMSVVKQYRKVVMTIVKQKLETWDSIQLGSHNTHSADVYDEEIFAERCAMVDKVKSEGLIGIFGQHRITDNPDTVYLSRTDLWYQFVDYIKASGVRMVTLRELYQIISDYKG